MEKIKNYFREADNNASKIIKKNNFCAAVRRFISRYLAGKRGENEINENNTLTNEIIRAELWKPFFTDSETFETEMGTIMSILTDEFEGSLKVGQAVALYERLGGDKDLIPNVQKKSVY